MTDLAYAEVAAIVIVVMNVATVILYRRDKRKEQERWRRYVKEVAMRTAMENRRVER
jgi:uncharacterized membrane protein YsdA (DUF1294 family)